jgi:hypothetical protein
MAPLITAPVNEKTAGLSGGFIVFNRFVTYRLATAAAAVI